MKFKVEEKGEVDSLEEKCAEENTKVIDKENSGGSDRGEENTTSEEVGGFSRVGGSFEEKPEGENMTVRSNGNEEENFRVGRGQAVSEESESGKSDEIGDKVGGRQGEPKESESEIEKGKSEEVFCKVGGRQGESEESESDKDKSEEVGYKVGGRQGEGAGRFLLAAKTFQPGQPVLLETPLVQVQQGIYMGMGGSPSNIELSN